MKTYLLTFLCVLFFSSSFAQSGLILYRVQVTLKDSTVLYGYANIRAKNKIVYRETKGEKRIKYDYRDVIQVLAYEDSKKVEYTFKYIPNDRPKGSAKLLLAPIITGKLNLHQRRFKSIGSQPTSSNPFGTYGGEVILNHLSKRGETKAYFIRNNNVHSKNFRKFAKIYFSDCQELLAKIKAKEFSKEEDKGIEEIVEYYNAHCGS